MKVELEKLPGARYQDWVIQFTDCKGRTYSLCLTIDELLALRAELNGDWLERINL